MFILTADAAIEQANWDTSKVRDKLRRDIDVHIASVRATKLSDLVAQYEVCNLGKYSNRSCSLSTDIIVGYMCCAFNVSILYHSGMT